MSVYLPAVEPWRVITSAAEFTLHLWVVDRWHGTIENRAPDEHDKISWFLPVETEQLDLADESLKALISDAAAL